MINIQIKNGDLIIGDSSKEIFNWKHRAFFNISLDFVEDEKNNCYFISNKTLYLDSIKEILLYLNEEGLEFITDENVDELLLEINIQNNEFNSVVADTNSDTIPIEQTATLKRKLKPYQLKGLEHFMLVKHGANYSVPGSGKTTMVYAYFDKLREEGIVEKIFVVGPFSSFSPWEEEAEACFGEKLNSIRLVGPKRHSYYLQPAKFELFLCPFQTAANDISFIIELCSRFKVLFVIDESHYIKRFEKGVWSSAILSIAPYATRRVVLSGTPMPNGYIDLWSQMTFLWPGKQLLGDRNAYKTRIDRIEEQEKVKIEIRPFFYRVKKSDLELPKPNIIKTEYSLNPIQAQIYHALSIKLITELNLQTDERTKLKKWRKAKMVRLLQAASNPTLLNRYSEEFDVPPLSADGTSLIELIEKYSQFEMPAKFEAAIKLIKKLLSEGKKVLLWTTFVHNIKMLENSLEGVEYFSIHGAIPRDDRENVEFNREKQINKFKTMTGPALLIANPAACAESISLHKICHDAIYLDRTFNCGQYIQSLDRIHRIGLEKDEIVNYHILLAKNTIDQTIDTRLDQKHDTMISVLEDEIPVGSLDIDGPEMESEDEITADFDATIKDVINFLKKS